MSDEVIQPQETPKTPHNKPRLIWAAVILTLLSYGLGHIYSGEAKRGISIYLFFTISYAALILTAALFPNIVVLIVVFLSALSLVIFIFCDIIKITKQKKIYSHKKYNKWYFYLLFLAASVFFYSIIYIPLIKKEIMETYLSPAGSMENTILYGDRFLVNKFTYKIGSWAPRRNDVVIFELYGMRDEVNAGKKIKYIKRIAGLPGDKIKITNYLVYINDSLQALPLYSKLPAITSEQSKINSNIFPKGSKWTDENYGPLAIPKRNDIIYLNVSNIDAWKVFIEREKHSVSVKDSTIFIDNSSAAEYKVERNYYFMLGDNRYNSIDSRFLGFVAEENILGTPTIIYWSWDSEIPFSKPMELISSIRWNRIGQEIN